MKINPDFSELHSLVKKMGAEKQHAQIKKEYSQRAVNKAPSGLYVSDRGMKDGWTRRKHDMWKNERVPLKKYVNHKNPTDFVNYRDGGPNGEIHKEMKQNQIEKQKQNQKFQTKGKKSLLTDQPTKSKGGGKSGGGGKFGGMFKGRGGSPWNLLKNDKSY